MPTAPYGPEEAQQRESLHHLGLLDTPIEQRFERITRMVCRLLDVPISAFSLIDGERQWFKSIQGVQATENRRQDSFCAYTIQGDDVLIIEDPQKDRRVWDNPLVVGAPNIAFYAGCPVRAPDNRNIGSLCAVDTKARRFDPDQIQLLRDLAAMIEAELKVAQLSRSQQALTTQLNTAHRLALIDPMTRIWNRAGTYELLSREFSIAISEQKPIALVMADIDLFKKINDTYGHQTGDTVIIESVKTMVVSSRPEDALGRLGGEEFLIIMPGYPVENLYPAIERIRQAVENTAIATEQGPIHATMSFGGTARIPTSEADISTMIKAADEALYRAKNAGRNRSEITF